eukprot:jgi/Botrbrau1/17307/Bobra.0015s0060.1
MGSHRTTGPRRGLAKGLKGLPVLLLVITGSIGLSYFIQGRLDVQAARDRALHLHNPDLPTAEKLTLEQELQKLSRKLDIKNYENKPVPR